MMRDGHGFNGHTIDPRPELLVGAAAHPYQQPMELSLLRLRKKIAAGADFLLTQAVTDLAGFTRWMDAIREAGLDQKVAIIAECAAERERRHRGGDGCRAQEHPWRPRHSHLERRVRSAGRRCDRRSGIGLDEAWYARSLPHSHRSDAAAVPPRGQVRERRLAGGLLALHQLRQAALPLRRLPARSGLQSRPAGAARNIRRVQGLPLLRAGLHQGAAERLGEPGIPGPGGRVLEAGHPLNHLEPVRHRQDSRLGRRLPRAISRAGLRLHLDRHVGDRAAHARRDSRARVHFDQRGYRAEAAAPAVHARWADADRRPPGCWRSSFRRFWTCPPGRWRAPAAIWPKRAPRRPRSSRLWP